MRRVSGLSLYSSDPDASGIWVGQHLAFVGRSEGTAFADVRFDAQPDPSTTSDVGLDAFWKISVFTDDIVKLSSALAASGRDVSEPVQFGDIGYLCHLQEPGGNAIELLQRTFKDNPAPAQPSPDTLGLITLRISDVDASLAFYQQGLGMRLLSTMAVDEGRADPFDLYFLGWDDEPLPDADVASVSNREWTYQRRATLIELQHYRTSLADLTSGRLQHVALATDDLVRLERDLTDAGTVVNAQDASFSFTSPDGHPFVASLV